ncbi:MAG: hypothetical protein U0174_17955 [Polyangiaceae bacterium]
MHPESPLRIPLVARALRSSEIRLAPRGIDNTWFYRQYVSRPYTGFNPFYGCVFYASNSAVAPWLAHPEKSARRYNAGDWMMRELLFIVHDYLHAWSYALIRELVPTLELGSGRITSATLEDFAFAHLLTEAVATVGLDYWCLATERLGDVCPMGTTLEGATTSYREWHRDEYARVWPDLVEVQDPAFLHWLVSCYVTGGARMSISERSMDRSALLARWIRGELSYARHQRRYIRRWLAHMSGLPLPTVLRDEPVRYDAAWQRDLVVHVAHRTWTLVKNDVSPPLKNILSRTEAWRAAPDSTPDFHLTNLNALSEAELLAASCPDSVSQRKALCEQYVVRYAFDAVSQAKRREIRKALRRHDFLALRRLLEKEARVQTDADEPRDLMFFG